MNLDNFSHAVRHMIENADALERRVKDLERRVNYIEFAMFITGVGVALGLIVYWVLIA